MNKIASFIILGLLVGAAQAEQAPKNNIAALGMEKGILTHAESIAVLNDWRHDDQDAYGSEALDYKFLRFQCYDFAQPECDLNYIMTIAKSELVGTNGSRLVTTPDYVKLELTKLFSENGVYEGWIKSQFSKAKKRGYYLAHCSLPLAKGGDLKSKVLTEKGFVQDELREQVNACLRAGDKILEPLINKPKP